MGLWCACYGGGVRDEIICIVGEGLCICVVEVNYF